MGSIRVWPESVWEVPDWYLIHYQEGGGGPGGPVSPREHRRNPGADKVEEVLGRHHNAGQARTQGLEFPPSVPPLAVPTTDCATTPSASSVVPAVHRACCAVAGREWGDP